MDCALGNDAVAPTIVLDDESRNRRKPKEVEEFFQSGIVCAFAGLIVEFPLKMIGAPRAPE